MDLKDGIEIKKVQEVSNMFFVSGFRMIEVPIYFGFNENELNRYAAVLVKAGVGLEDFFIIITEVFDEEAIVKKCTTKYDEDFIYQALWDFMYDKTGGFTEGFYVDMKRYNDAIDETFRNALGIKL